MKIIDGNLTGSVRKIDTNKAFTLSSRKRSAARKRGEQAEWILSDRETLYGISNHDSKHLLILS